MWWTIALFIILCVLISVLPWCRRQEILWLFVSYSIAAVPGNAHMIYRCSKIINAFNISGLAGTIVICAGLFLLLTWIEQLAVLLLGRLIWPEQEAFILEDPVKEKAERKTEEYEKDSEGEEEIYELPCYRR